MSGGPIIRNSSLYKNISNSNNSQGTTLVELLTGLAIFSIVSVLVGSMTFHFQKQFLVLSAKVQQETDAEEMGIVLRRFLSQAVELRLVANTAAVVGTPVSNLDGRITRYDLDANWSVATALQVDPVAIFYVDDQPSDIPPQPAAERFRPIAFFVQQPSRAAYGLMAVKAGAAADLSINGSNPTYRFTNIVDFKITNLVFESPAVGVEKVKSLSVIFTKRYFNKVDFAAYRWCPPTKQGDPGCAPDASFRDITKTIDITIRNNILGPSYAQRQFNATDPTRWFDPLPKRAYDGLYFLRTRFPVEALKR